MFKILIKKSLKLKCITQMVVTTRHLVSTILLKSYGRLVRSTQLMINGNYTILLKSTVKNAGVVGYSCHINLCGDKLVVDGYNCYINLCGDNWYQGSINYWSGGVNFQCKVIQSTSRNEVFLTCLIKGHDDLELISYAWVFGDISPIGSKLQ